MKKGVIVLVVFPFTDLSGTKLRPALVIAETYQSLTVIFITTNVKWQDQTDVVMMPDSQNGLKAQSLLKLSKIATLDKSLVKGRLGQIDNVAQHDVDSKLKQYFQLV